jgi:hypothetical protein
MRLEHVRTCGKLNAYFTITIVNKPIRNIFFAVCFEAEGSNPFHIAQKIGFQRGKAENAHWKRRERDSFPVTLW